MSDNDLTLIAARCLQNFADVENHDPNKCYVPPSLETLDERAKQSYLNDALFHRKVDTIVYAVREHNTALRAQVAELKEFAVQHHQTMNEQSAKIVEPQRQLSAYEEAAKQEPVATVIRNSAGQISIQNPDGSSFDVSKHIGATFYAAPINLPALIEQEKAEAMEECAKVCDQADKSTHPADLADAIRARKQ